MQVKFKSSLGSTTVRSGQAYVCVWVQGKNLGGSYLFLVKRRRSEL